MTVVFAFSLLVALIWFGLNFSDIWYPSFEAISGRFSTTAILRISAALSVSVTLSSGLLWWYHKQEASYTTPLEFFFGVCFGFFLFILMLTSVPALFSG